MFREFDIRFFGRSKKVLSRIRSWFGVFSFTSPSVVSTGSEGNFIIDSKLCKPYRASQHTNKFIDSARVKILLAN